MPRFAESEKVILRALQTRDELHHVEGWSHETASYIAAAEAIGEALLGNEVGFDYPGEIFVIEDEIIGLINKLTK